MQSFEIKYLRLMGLLLLLAVMVISACSSGPSHFRRSVSVSDIFEQHRILPDHHYFYYGHPHAPLAMVAVKKGYQLDAPKWTSIQLKDKELGQWVERMRNQPGAEFNIDPNGALIMDNSGNSIGMWYSVWKLPILEFKSEKVFTLSDPMTRFPIRNRDPERPFRNLRIGTL